MITSELWLSLLVERFGIVPDDERHAPPRPVLPRHLCFPTGPVTVDSPEIVAARQATLMEVPS